MVRNGSDRKKMTQISRPSRPGEEMVSSGIQDREPGEAGTSWGLSRRELVGELQLPYAMLPWAERKGETPLVSLNMLLPSRMHACHVHPTAERGTDQEADRCRVPHRVY